MIADIHGGATAQGALTRVPTGQREAAWEAEIRYESRGLVLVIGLAERAVAAAIRLAPQLRVLVCTSDPAAATATTANPAIMTAAVAQVEGYLGRFAAKVHAGKATVTDLAPFSSNADGLFDLVLDLSATPLLAMQVQPAGYFAPGASPAGIDAAIAELLTLVGHFQKPRYYKYDKALCTHGSQGVTGCTRCLEVCPAAAIRGKGDSIEIDPHLCQGCATCMLVCPTGALTYAIPPAAPAPIPPRLEGARRALLICEPGDKIAAKLFGRSPGQFERREIPAIASASIEIWLTALADGFAQVIIVPPATLPANTLGALRAQLALAQSLLKVMQRPTESIVMVGNDELPPAVPTIGAEPGVNPVAHRDNRLRREAIFTAIDTLDARVPSAESSASDALPSGSPFGTVVVDRITCTLCMACVNLCPTDALATGAPGVLRFTESQCVQCGLCERGCPEKSITLSPRLVPGRAARESSRVLNQDTPHQCPECGAPFISKALLAKSLQIVRTQNVLDEHELTLLNRCPSCRAQLMSLR